MKPMSIQGSEVPARLVMDKAAVEPTLFWRATGFCRPEPVFEGDGRRTSDRCPLWLSRFR